MAKCVLCPPAVTRKGRRWCPAVMNHICARCCATNRMVKLKCPQTCPYLTQAQTITVEQQESELQERGAERARLESQCAAYAVAEAIVSFNAAHTDLTDADVTTALTGLRESIEKEIALGQRFEIQMAELPHDLAELILQNASTMREYISIPSNPLLRHAIHTAHETAIFHSQSNSGVNGYLDLLRTHVQPGSLMDFIKKASTQLAMLPSQ